MYSHYIYGKQNEKASVMGSILHVTLLDDVKNVILPVIKHIYHTITKVYFFIFSIFHLFTYSLLAKTYF